MPARRAHLVGVCLLLLAVAASARRLAEASPAPKAAGQQPRLGAFTSGLLEALNKKASGARAVHLLAPVQLKVEFSGRMRPHQLSACGRSS
jgi:hypothetical protein